ncbi:cellulose biosynthesis protein BcsN [Methylobacterium nodulans]|uniref:Cellulose biosynthesis protein BcsN n=1 Tax=Methylobacterium nodulans (strain LMG 21967 / CNCM I-2342 / ORS 2060) TaxID=460265 RepID=B8IRA4_METNO|nr:cellulose biosynthesis protein BcsN [Methylobacterium nodulans]ACL58644.1 conserved hypothetical protein [Methylobacterium nodulans ORS 2060]
MRGASRPRFGALLLGSMVVAAPGRGLAQPAPVLHLPGAGRVAGIEEIRVRDGFDQHIRFEGGDGRNRAEVGLRTETGDLLLAFPPRLAKPNELGIAGELAARFPGQMMRVVTTPQRNAYGPIGLAVSADCLYAWQWFERASRAARGDERPGLLGPLSPPPAGRQALSLRIRLCRTAQASLGDLLRAVARMTIALPHRPALASREAIPSPPVARPAKPRSRPAQPKPAAPVPARARTAPEAPVARPSQPPPAAPAPPSPPPPSDSSEPGRRYIVPPAPAAPAPPAAPPDASAPSGPQRYITDGMTAPAPPGGSHLAPQPAPGRTPGESLSRDLPPEAYRPPPLRSPPDR